MIRRVHEYAGQIYCLAEPPLVFSSPVNPRLGRKAPIRRPLRSPGRSLFNARDELTVRVHDCILTAYPEILSSPGGFKWLPAL